MSMNEKDVTNKSELSAILDRFEAKNEAIAKLTSQVAKLKQDLKEAQDQLNRPVPQNFQARPPQQMQPQQQQFK